MISIFRAKKIMDRLNRMVDHAISGDQIEDQFDETQMSALETKLNRYLTMSKRKQQLVEEEKLKIKELISDISHQTKTPIANLMLYSSLLAEQENFNEDQKIFVDEIQKQSEKLQFLITSLIKTSRLETGIITLAPIKNDVNDLIADAINQVSIKAKYKNIIIQYDDRVKLSGQLDYKWTLEALYNILDNAVKYSNENGKIQVDIKNYELFYAINIQDNGIGIPFEEQNKIFMRFYRSPAVTEKEGVGIGLFLAREIIERQGGYIKVDSELDKGTTFSLFLPKL